MSIEDWLTGTIGLLSGFGIFFLGIASLMPYIKKWIQKRNIRESVTNIWKIENWSLFLGFLLIITSLFIFTSIILISQKRPLNVELTTKAWKAYNTKNYYSAIFHAEECINKFRCAADKKQEYLESKGWPLPIAGRVLDREEARGLLNDVGTCFFIKGLAFEELSNKEEAKKAYLTAAEYTYARCYDPIFKIFWVVSEEASHRVKLLK